MVSNRLLLGPWSEYEAAQARRCFERRLLFMAGSSPSLIKESHASVTKPSRWSWSSRSQRPCLRARSAYAGAVRPVVLLGPPCLDHAARPSDAVSPLLANALRSTVRTHPRTRGCASITTIVPCHAKKNLRIARQVPPISRLANPEQPTGASRHWYPSCEPSSRSANGPLVR